MAELRDDVPYSGRTDTAITRDLLRVHGIDPTPANQQTLRETYLAHLPASLTAKGGTVCPGIPELLAAVAGKPGVVLGLLTGNVRAGAQVKLGHFGLWDFFACGGFGDDHFDRDDVARAALASARATPGHRRKPFGRMGDRRHPARRELRRAVGANAVAVATGWHPLEELAGHKPDLIFDDLSDHSRLLSVWG